MIPITYGHDYSKPAVGRMVQRGGKLVIEFNPEAKIKESDINMVNGSIMPSYVVTKVEDGVVLECELIGFGIVGKNE